MEEKCAKAKLLNGKERGKKTAAGGGRQSGGAARKYDLVLSLAVLLPFVLIFGVRRTINMRGTIFFFYIYIARVHTCTDGPAR